MATVQFETFALNLQLILSFLLKCTYSWWSELVRTVLPLFYTLA